MDGGDGDDTMNGGDGDDTMAGGVGNDLIHGGIGNDALSGDDGADTFFFDTALGATNVDTILDMERKVDDIALSQTIFTAVGASLSKGEFYIGKKAHDGNDHIIYNKNNGNLYYDDDGKGGDARILFAVLDDHLKLKHTDFTVVA